VADDFVCGNMQFYNRNGEWIIKPINNNGVQEIIQSLIDDIERLRAERDAERALADQLASHLEWALKCVGSLPMQLRATFDARTAEVVAAYEEARRG
jgi:hypothetical protein